MAGLTELPALNATRFSSPRFVAETGSTNADLLIAARDGAPEGAVLVTDHQTAGRGRQRRSWHDEPGNALLVSLLLRPANEHAPLMPLLAGVAACHALSDLAGAVPPEGPAGLKWPNDVLAPALGERKLAGILAESATVVPQPTGPDGPPSDPDPGPANGEAGRLIVVVGMGMNLRWASPPPDEIAAKAATVGELLGRQLDRAELLDRYLRFFEQWLRRLASDGPEPLLAAYRQVCLTLGRRVRFATSSAEFEGTAVEVTGSGTLILETADRGRIELHAGDAHHVPPPDA